MNVHPPHSAETYRILLALSQDGVYRVEYDPPIDITLPVQEQVQLARQNSQLVECNDALAQQFGLNNTAELLAQMPTTPQTDESTRVFIANGYRLDNVEINGTGPLGQKNTYLVSSLGIVRNGFLVSTWTIQHDVTEARYTEARLQEYASRLESQNKDLAVLHRVAVAAANATDENALIEQITTIIGRTLYPDIFGVMVVDEEKNVLRPHPSYRGIDEEMRRQEVPLSQGISGYVARTGQTKRVNDVTQEPIYVCLYETIRSEMCVPIRIGQRIIGVINIESVQRDAFSASDERLITICAGQLATAIEQLRTEAKEQRRRVWLEKVLDLGKAITQITDWDICVRQIHHIARHELGFDRVGLFRYEPADQTVHGLLGTSPTGEPQNTSWFVTPVTQDITFQRVLADPKGFVFHANLSTIIQRPSHHEMAGVKNHATVAAWAGDEPIAVIAVDNVISQRPMSEEQLEGLRLFAGYAGLALENARLLGQVRQAEEKYRSIFENSLEGIFQTTLQGRFLHANPAMARICGYDSPQELISDINNIAYQLYHHPHQRAELLALLASQDEVQQFEFQVRQKNGQLLWVSANSRTVRDEQGQILYLEGTIQDINEQKLAQNEREKLEAQLRQAQKMEAIGRLTGGIAHDFNNLLTVILSAGDLLLRHFPDEANPAYRWIINLKQAGEKAAALIRQLLAFSRQQVLELTILDLNEVVTQFADMFRRLIGEDIELVLELREKLGRIQADVTQVEQIILNLVVNARDAMSGGGKLIMQTDNVYLDEHYCRQAEGISPGEYVMLAISDTGVGMDAETQSRIFEPFFTTKELGKGTGLGLATVYGIVRQFGGHIAVYSEVGMGATFKIYLPCVDAAANQLPSTSPIVSEPLVGRETILLVEDDQMVRELAREVLDQAGYEVITITAQQAIALIRQNPKPIHLLLTDVVMPEMSGRDLAEQLLLLRPQLKILYMSGYADALIRHHGLIKTDLAFLPKPFTPASLMQKVRDTLDR